MDAPLQMKIKFLIYTYINVKISIQTTAQRVYGMTRADSKPPFEFFPDRAAAAVALRNGAGTGFGSMARVVRSRNHVGFSPDRGRKFFLALAMPARHQTRITAFQENSCAALFKLRGVPCPSSDL
jgi:hypothetical protein